MPNFAMKRRVAGQVETITAERQGAQELLVRVAAEESRPIANAAATVNQESGELRPAINLVELCGRVRVGDQVLLNTVAVELGLGTGGQDFVVAVLRDEEPDAPAPGHILKLRYTPLQVPVLAVESPESPHHEALRRFQSLNEMPVVCAQLHSQIPAICAGARWALMQHGGHRPRIAYIMTDGAALPLALSRLIPELREKSWISATITAGQAFGGDYECVNVYSALATAYAVVGADMAIVCQGPGNVGTGTPLGFSGLEQGQAINAVASLSGTAIAAARISFADARERHRGISHHTQTVLKTAALAQAMLPLPVLEGEQMQILLDTLEDSGLEESHQPVFIMADSALDLLQSLEVNVTTMGRDVEAERPFFLSACAAGILAGQFIEAKRD